MAELRDRLTKPFPELQNPRLTVDQLDTILRTPLTLHLPANDVEPHVLFDHPYLIPRHQLAGTVFSQISGLLTSILFLIFLQTKMKIVFTQFGTQLYGKLLLC